MAHRQAGTLSRAILGRSALLRSVSVATLAMLGVMAAPAEAQLAARRGATLTAPTVAPRAVPGQVRSQQAADGLGRQTAVQTRVEQIRTFATQARAAATRSVPNGLTGLVVARGVTAEALAAGALQAARDSTGRMTWQGADLPAETPGGAGALVTIRQTESRAVLSWDRFDVGSGTTLQFDQKLNGLAQKDWVAVNRVVDAAAAPSQILGQIRADGTVVVLNRNGVIFGSGSQVSANALLASALDIGNFVKTGPVPGSSTPGYVAATLQERNVDFLQNGLLPRATVDSAGFKLAGTLTSGLVSGAYPSDVGQLEAAFAGNANSEVLVENGASITSGKGGFVILTGPRVTNAGKLISEEGQVSLQAGHAISATVSTGSSNSADADVRGLILRSTLGGTGSEVVNSGLIETRRGYASIGAGLGGSAVNSGLIAASTSVARNGFISVTAGNVRLAGADGAGQASGLVITADDNGETLPQGTADNPAQFKRSRIDIGGIYLDATLGDTSPLGDLGPASVTMGRNALIHAPNARVNIGGEAGSVFVAADFVGSRIPDAASILAASKIDVASSALIDVSGIKDYTVDASRNSLKIDPVKRNELRDTPNYRETAEDGGFTLNGATLYVDPRISGVRSDGVAYIGSPLVEAGSAASQIALSASEFMTKGGDVVLNVGLLGSEVASAPAMRVSLDKDAAIDFSGGWVRYLDGVVRTSRLLTEDGRVVDVSVADPNDRFVAVGDGFTEVQAKFGISRTYASSVLQGERFEAGYDEGRDAGSLIVSASTGTLDAALYGNSFAGVRQLSAARRASAQPSLAGDLRSLQGSAYELPAGGYLRIGAFERANLVALTGDVVIAGAGATVPSGAFLLDAETLSRAGLSALSIRTTASVNLRSGTNLTLANGGNLAIVAGRTVKLDGTVSAPAGNISVQTVDFGYNPQVRRSTGSAGSPFRSDDNLTDNFASDPSLHPYDIEVGGTLSTAGQWVNDFSGSGLYAGSAWSNGGAISIEVAPNVFVGVGGTAQQPLAATDLSGSIRIAASGLLDVSSGGYIGADGTFELTGKGGDVSLTNATVYASRQLTDLAAGIAESNSTAEFPIGGTNQTVEFTPYSPVRGNVVTPGLVPAVRNAEVSFAASSLKGFGFSGGGVFSLVAPDIAMGSQPVSNGPRVDLDFLRQTGFGTLDLTAIKSRFVDGLFANGRTGTSAFLDTERFVVGAGQTLDLTQTVLPSILDTTTLNRLASLDTGGSLSSVLTPGVPADPYDRLAAHLKLAGITELEVAAGGTLTGAAGASIVAPRIYNAGTIRIAGGSIEQVDALNSILSFNSGRALGVRDVALGGGLSDVLGGGIAGQTSGFDELALAKADVFTDLALTDRLTNGELFSLVAPGATRSLDVNLIFTGRVALNEGIRLTAGSVTDLSGTALFDPRAGFLANGTQRRSGVLVDGGSIRTSFLGVPLIADGYRTPIDPANKLFAEAGSTINLNGASAVFDERTSRSVIEGIAHWSNAGQLAVGGGAVLTGAAISAIGGDDGDADLTSTRASGGLLDWRTPVIRQSSDGTLHDGSVLFADELMNAGFSSLVARGSLDFAGAVNLTLAETLLVTSEIALGVPQTTSTPLTISAAPDSEASVSASHIRFASNARAVSALASTGGAGTLSFKANAIDVAGAVGFRVSSMGTAAKHGSVSLEAVGDIRFIGVPKLVNSAGLIEPGLTGQLISNGDLSLKAAQAYATTGTGDLQALLELRRNDPAAYVSLLARQRSGSAEYMPFIVGSIHGDGRIKISGNGGAVPATPYSAGSYLAVRGANIEQDGVLRAPMGFLEIGSTDSLGVNGLLKTPVTKTLTLGEASLTSVSAATGASGTTGLSVPYGTTTDLIEYFFSPGVKDAITTVPVGELRLAGGQIDIQSANAADIRVDARGGGDVFAFEFVPGTGGSRDVLSRFNVDDFSSNDGLQYADGRQVYALLPANLASVAMFDPIYSADYLGSGKGGLYGLSAGSSVTLDAAPGIAAGEYLLLPAHYALLPGGLRIVENTGASAPFVGGATTLLDGSVVVGGTYSSANGNLAESARRSFTVQSQNVFLKYSNIGITGGSEYVTDLAGHKALTLPSLPRDAARVVLSPLTSLKVAGAFANAAATGGIGAQVDIGGSAIRVAAPGALPEATTSDYVLLTTDTLANLNANSLSIGALRTDNVNGTTTLDVVTRNILVDNDVDFSAPELLLAVGGPGSRLALEDAPRGVTGGARLTATGALSNPRSGDYIVNATAARDGSTGTIDQTGAGVLLRLATGPERLVSREGDFAVRNTTLPTVLDLGRGSVLGAPAITIDSSRTFQIDKTAIIGGVTTGDPFTLGLSGDLLRLGGVNFPAEIEQQFGLASRLTLRSPDVVNFSPTSYAFKDLVIDAPGIGWASSATALTDNVNIVAGNVTLLNTSKDLGSCREIGITLCGDSSGSHSLTIDAQTISFGSGNIWTHRFNAGPDGKGITLKAREGMYVSGKGQFGIGVRDNYLEAPLNLETPFIVDRTASSVVDAGYQRPDYTFRTDGAISVKGAAGASPTPAGDLAPGASITLSNGAPFYGIVSDILVENSLIRASAGTVNLRTNGSILIEGNASIQVPGYEKTFDDGIDRTVVSASAGAINLASSGGGTRVAVGRDASLVVDNGIGKAGTLNISASQSDVSLQGRLNPGVAAGTTRTASFLLDSGDGAFDLPGFIGSYGNLFQGELAIRTARGDLAVNTGQLLRAASLSLTADGGSVLIAGVIDTSGDNVAALSPTDPRYSAARVDGGDISLFGRDGLTITSSASLVSRTYGYSNADGRQASGGDVILGVGIPEAAGTNAATLVESGAKIDISAMRPGDRLIEEIVTDTITLLQTRVNRLALGDTGGSVTFRAPLLSTNRVNLTNAGSVVGASELAIEGYRRFDLGLLADAGTFAGISRVEDTGLFTIQLDAGAVAAGKANFLSDVAPGTVAEFVRSFSLTGASGESFAGYRLRPGVELVADEAIALRSVWNLGAGEIVNRDGSSGIGDALAAGVLTQSALGRFATGALAGTSAYEVVAGRESELFDNFIDMRFRVGGDVRGEAPVVSIRASGNLDIVSSGSVLAGITDGFFTFRDLSNPDYINYQLGGGDRTYRPALRINCGSGDAALCSDSSPFANSSGLLISEPVGTRVTIQIGAAQQGQESSPYFINAPYNPQANAAAAAGTGDPFGTAELFPLLADGTAVRSSSIRLVAGAQETSANPMQIDSATAGTMKVAGERFYEAKATPGTARIAGSLQLFFDDPLDGTPSNFFDPATLLALIDSGSDSEYQADAFAVLNWGAGATGAAGEARRAARAYAPFTTDANRDGQPDASFVGPRLNPTGVTARLRDIVAFLSETGYADTYARGVEAGAPGYSSANLVRPIAGLRNDTMYVASLVRTGDGSLSVAAAADVDLRRFGLEVNRIGPDGPGSDLAPVGGTSLYTAGVRAAEDTRYATTFREYASAPLTYVPGVTSGLYQSPVYATGGGDVTISAGRDVLGRRDLWNEQFGNAGTTLNYAGSSGTQLDTLNAEIMAARGMGARAGQSPYAINSAQRWRFGGVGATDTHVAIMPNHFTSGVGALAGGDVAIRAGRDVSSLTVAAVNSMVTGTSGGRQTLVPLGAGDLTISAGQHLVAGQFDVALGKGSASAGGDVQAAGFVKSTGATVFGDTRDLLRVRVADASFDLTAAGSVLVGGVGALAPNMRNEAFVVGLDSLGFFSSLAGFSATANETVTLIGNSPEFYLNVGGSRRASKILPPSLSMISLAGDVGFGTSQELAAPKVLASSPYGQLSLLAGGDIGQFGLAMSDAAPTNFFGWLSMTNALFPTMTADTEDAELRQLHDRNITHRGDSLPARIVADGSIDDIVLSLPKQARITAGVDIIDLLFRGQHVAASDVTRISAGRDITGTIGTSDDNKSFVRGNQIALGGQGTLIVEAGRDLGPFVTSTQGARRTESGGILTIGNEANPWLPSQGANIYALFGVGNGVNFDGLQSTYLDPAKLAQLDGDLFEQNEDAFGNKAPDRSRFSYAPLLAEWLRDNHPDAFAAVFGATPPTGNALTTAAYAQYSGLYGAFASLDSLARRRFLIDKLYFSELAAPSDPTGESFNQFVRGYRAVEALFPAAWGYTDNLATYDLDASTVNADHPLGVPVRKQANGVPVQAVQVNTGNVDLRLSTIRTSRGGDITILGPGGNFVAGSVVRTEAQLARRASAFNVDSEILEGQSNLITDGNYQNENSGAVIRSIPAGAEGILTLRGGAIRGFTDGSFILNQSRLFTLRGGDITLWSSNGDLNAGQGPRSASSFPPITLRFSPNGGSEVDSAGSVAGAGIGAFKGSPTDPSSAVRLIAPVGTVDAGDAGVRATGDIFVAAARVANADNFAAGGAISGVPSLAGTAAPPAPASAASAIAANAFRAAEAVGDGAGRASRIFVDVLGSLSAASCPEGERLNADGNCEIDRPQR